AAGEKLTLAYDVTINDGHADGIATQRVTITITGTNDAPVITSAAQSGAVSEGDDGASKSASGQVTFSDVDASDTHIFSLSSAAAYGSASVAQDGSWHYTVSDAGAVDALAAGETLSDTFTVKVADSQGGFASQDVKITITGTNDAPVIGGVHTGAVTEDVNVVAGNISTSGALTIADVDAGQSNFAAQAGTLGSNGYGTFTLAADGSWTYTANDSQAAIQQLGAGQSITDSFTAVSSDGSASQLVTV